MKYVLSMLLALTSAFLMVAPSVMAAEESVPAAAPVAAAAASVVVEKPVEQGQAVELAEAAEVQQLEQYGITWKFAAPVKAGRFVTGDWWVVGPVTVESVTPAPADDQHGSVVNPPAGGKQGYDKRIAGYDASLRAEFPLELKAGQSLVSTASVEKVGQKTPDTVRGQYARGPLRTAVVLTVLEEVPAKDAFRPAYVGQWRESFRVSQLRLDALPKVKAPEGVGLPNVAELERMMERIWLDHMRQWVNRMMHPLENMPDYGREITNITSNTSLLLTLDDPEGKFDTLRLRFVQLGIDYYGAVQSNDNLWQANGGHNSGRKIPILVAGLLLGHEGMMNVKAVFQEDQQTYVGEGWRGQKVLWVIDNSEARKHEHLPPEKWAGPPFVRDNDGWKSEGYRALNGPTWVAQALAARLMGLKDNWNHQPYFDYVDRWIAEAPHGRIKKDTLEPSSYDPFPSKFVKAMWETYRDKADEIGAASGKK